MAVQLAQSKPYALPQLPLTTNAGKTYTATPLSYAAPLADQGPFWLHQLEGLVLQRRCEVGHVHSHAHAVCDRARPSVDESPTQFPDSAYLRGETAQAWGRRIPTHVCASGSHELHSPRHFHLAAPSAPGQAEPTPPSKYRESTAARTAKCRPRNLSGEARRWESWAPTLEFWRSIPAIRRNATLQPCGSQRGLLLPPKRPDDEGRCTLILDLDETLVRAEVTLGVREDTACTFVSGGRVHGVRVNIRPGAAAFLAILAEWFELVIFTASCRDYAEPVLDLLDPDDSIFAHRLFRDSCRRLSDGQYIKDLSMLGRDLRSTIIVDNTPTVYSLHLDNAIPISSWFCDPSDKALLQLLPLLCHLANVGDVRSPLRRIYRLPDLVFAGACTSVKSTNASH